MSSPFFKKMMLEKSNTFCMAPWTHIHTTPTGVVTPCCISKACGSQIGMADARTSSLMDAVNCDQMKQLRLDMLNGVKNPECNVCHSHEEQGVKSFRMNMNADFANHFDELIEHTNTDGSLNEFQMKYFDIRFSNICNFKCRTCNSSFSTQWEQEDLKAGLFHARIVPKNDNPEFLSDVIGQIEHMEKAYFAGGEPLITEEHYILLEEMIKQGRTDIKLSYNTNLSNLKFKNKDLLSLWKNFDNPIYISASIDHYGERAEYIRSGTDWGKVEANFKKAKKTPYINLQMNTVLSVFNYLTLYDFYKYLIDKKLYTPKDWTFSLYNMSTPPHLTAHILPPDLKQIGVEKMKTTIDLFTEKKFKPEQIKQLSDTTPWVLSQNTWDTHKKYFKDEVKRLDIIRGENFQKIFPELAILLEDERKRHWPI
jgi:hypothetical protein